MNESLLTILKFGIVGASGVALDFAVTWFLKEKIGMRKYAANRKYVLLCVAIKINVTPVSVSKPISGYRTMMVNMRRFSENSAHLPAST